MMDLFKGKTVIVTGGASGMGRAMCEKLGASGARVTVADIDQQGAHQAAEAIRKSGGKAVAAFVDTSDREAMESLVLKTSGADGRLDYLFNNAGILIAGEVRDMDQEHWQKIFDVNFFGVLHGALAAYAIMIKQGFGHIVNTASTAGLVAIPSIAAYCATKHAVMGFSNALRQEGAGLGVKVSVVCPGFVDTGIFGKGLLLKGDMHQYIGAMPIKPIQADKAAEIILKGVAKNRPMIVFPAHARILWAIYRLCPSFYGWGSRKVVDDFRQMKTP